MYFVNRNDIEKLLLYYERVIDTLDQTASFTNDIERFALERIIHVLVESMLDTGNKMIDGFIMRDPGSYHDIIDILTDEQVLPQEAAPSYKAMIDARQRIVKHYLEIDAAMLMDTVTTHWHVLQQFPTHIRTYLDEETSVANAFTNEE